MNANPMEEQIGRLVGNLLAGGGEIFLPGVGSLYTERQGARRLNRRTVLPPSRTVAFTSQQRGVSLVDEIARVMREAGGGERLVDQLDRARHLALLIGILDSQDKIAALMFCNQVCV